MTGNYYVCIKSISFPQRGCKALFAIIGGTITSTLLTLLVVPTFYDSIEIAKDRMMDKMHARGTRYHPSLAFIVTMLEAFFTLTFVRLIYRSLLKLWRLISGRKASTGVATVSLSGADQVK